jgi:hypothetical protein
VDEEDDADMLRRVLVALGLDADHPLVSYLVRRHGSPVGIAQRSTSRGRSRSSTSAWSRASGAGAWRALARLGEGGRRGCETAVLAPSPDGQMLYESLGFTTSPTPPDHWFYLPVGEELSRDEPRTAG